ncbi:hypothetical protein SMACR_08997 [Sordaria macrospora]|uniref:WGS project CABT00000000 data, contig 2.31 n=2 Tax=Sordaria macrospora TaxID=5147 RepID=F7W5R8_SORMK|nr:uncharacterized protein SMAC_08997 [Sordaria macrospora k-hell]KAA8635530.1 hypothetical protein SMACR_08997 [Sordaria macrospora]KAH7629513.1 hypothetical protein B0T09DRAFT_308691 [Sordaria sp. MPI-SDFR-AT-0083]WPJ66273.1 hypothetical protein SMAC4_08997 [Sordaria macrospora]CCC12856.1 unnamed protein product [Sordaria macrospora k-hell]
MQLISALTALAGLQFAVAFPSSILNGMSGKHLVARNVTSGSMLCTDKIQKGNCETLMVDYVANPGSCIALDAWLTKDGVSSIYPQNNSFCTYYATNNCVDQTTDLCGHYDATSAIEDLSKVTPTPQTGKTCRDCNFWIQGSMLCTEVNYLGYCQEFAQKIPVILYEGETSDHCETLDERLSGNVSSVMPLGRNRCCYYDTVDCSYRNKGCGYATVYSHHPKNDLRNLAPAGYEAKY